MEGLLPSINHYELSAVVESLKLGDNDPNQMRLMHSAGPTDAWSWLTVPPASADLVTKARVALLPLDTEHGATHLVTRIVPDPALDVFDLIPDSFGRREGIVFRCRDVVDAVQAAPMRRFLSDVFSIPTVFRYFWTSPGSQAHHHAYAGGNADHSVEIAENVVDTPRLSATERDVGIAFALTHDVGKLWCYSEEGRRLEALGHELVALNQLHDALETLAHDWPDGAIALRSLLSGLWKQRGGKPIITVGKLVQAYDQASAERELATRKGHRHQPWQARPYLSDIGASMPVRR